MSTTAQHTQKKKYICNGRFFATFEEVENYAKLIGKRVTNTVTYKGRYIISIAE